MFLVSLLISGGLILSLPVFASEAGDDASSGRISGVVTLAGPVPASPVLSVSRNSDFCGDRVADPVLMVNAESRGVKNALVYLHAAPKGETPPTRTVISAFSCLFNPRVAVAVPEGVLVLYNSDPILHSPRATTSAGKVLFNLALPEHRGEVRHRLKNEGFTEPIRLQCGIHAHMYSFIAVLDHPFYAVTDDLGRFSIPDVPAGIYELMAWHQGVRPTTAEAGDLSRDGFEPPVYEEPYLMRQSVEVGAGRETTINFVFSVRN